MNDAQNRPTAHDGATTAYRLISSAQGRLSKCLEDLEHWLGDPERVEPATLAVIEHEAGAARAELSAGTIAASYAYTGALIELWSRVAGAQPTDLRVTLDPDGSASEDTPILAEILDEILPQLQERVQPATVTVEPNVTPVAATGWGRA